MSTNSRDDPLSLSPVVKDNLVERLQLHLPAIKFTIKDSRKYIASISGIYTGGETFTVYLTRDTRSTSPPKVPLYKGNDFTMKLKFETLDVQENLITPFLLDIIIAVCRTTIVPINHNSLWYPMMNKYSETELEANISSELEKDRNYLLTFLLKDTCKKNDALKDELISVKDERDEILTQWDRVKTKLTEECDALRSKLYKYET